MDDRPRAEFPAPVVEIVRRLRDGEFITVLVGGVAMVLLGSPEVTRDFDIVVDAKAGSESKATAARLMYESGFRMATKIDPVTGDILEFVDEAGEATAHVAKSDVNVAFFWHPADRIRLDILFDFPIPAKELIANAERVKLCGGEIEVFRASPRDLKNLKSISYNYRRHPKDLRDIEFLEKIIARREE